MLVVGQIAEPKSLDPAAVTAVNDFRILVNLYEGLLQYKAGTLEVAPALATEWSVSDDGTEYTFTLREGVTFHDGTPFDAEAVKFNFDRMLNEDHPYHDTGPFPLAFFFSSVQSTEAVDPMTVKFTLDAPYAPFLSNLAYPTGLMVSPAAVMAAGADFGRSPVGTGPFKFAEWRSNEAVVIEKNADYWGDPAGTDAVIFRPITDANTRVAEMLAGGIDMMVEVPPTALSEFQGDGFSVRRTGRSASLVPDPERQGRPVCRQAGAPGRKLRDQQGSDRERRARRHRGRGRRPDPAGLRLGL